MIQNKIYTIIGHKGYGKTTLTEKLAILTDKPTIILDPRFQYEENIRRLVFTSVSKFHKFITKRDNYKLFMKHKLELVVNTIDEAEELAETIFKMKNITFVIDEIDMFFDTRTDKKSYFNKLVQYGRHNRIDIITTSRRPANISRNLTALTDIFIFSRLREPNDKKYIKALLDSSYAEMIADLNKFEFLRIEDEKKEIIKTTEKDLQILS
ncbi:hypothetical protein AMRN_1423 [Malaciobacter marinus]|uniref:AAA+ ATPase domain-containing protein n=1 Tax=Malaciobacter marinus TaxID=505249 RepID=A0A347TKN1_9BACT|nr:AAA family ATPase [Malaciobacter marinus]AXX87159.1 hypothetical protein AMRN_1423 [Malaciobacter marinus]